MDVVDEDVVDVVFEDGGFTVRREASVSIAVRDTRRVG